ncbi:MAG: hypothetical protein IGS48_10970 [Oscillatoriales cyanobacterium C42_A2020_001]|nr:hypothetical protein [Leptolyngbyaceae cyanobacterium C42_A2020_001]
MFSEIDLPVPFTTTDSSSIHTSGLYSQANALHSALLVRLNDPYLTGSQVSQSSSSMDYSIHLDPAGEFGMVSHSLMSPSFLNGSLFMPEQAILNSNVHNGWLFNSGVETVYVQMNPESLMQSPVNIAYYTFSTENQATSTEL